MSKPSRRGRIPIPSFSTAVAGIVDEEFPTPRKQSILLLEGALQLHFTRTHTRYITYRAFCSLAAKIQNDATKTCSMSSSQDSAALLGLSKEELFWHDLYCVAVPTLYAVSRQNESMTLQEVVVEGNRSRELRRLFDDTSTQSSAYKKASRQALDLLQSVRSTNHPMHTQQGSKSADAPSESVFKTNQVKNDASVVKPGMTLEERVTARSKQREADLQKFQDAQENSFEDRLSVADALYSHACHLLQRNKVFASKFVKNNNPNNNKPVQATCVLIFKDVVKVVANRNRKEITRILKDINKVSSDFISWSSNKQKPNSVPIAKDATIRINTTNYKRVRILLSGEKFPAEEGGEPKVQGTPIPPTAIVSAADAVSLPVTGAMPVVGAGQNAAANDDTSPTSIKQRKKSPPSVGVVSTSGLATVTPSANTPLTTGAQEVGLNRHVKNVPKATTGAPSSTSSSPCKKRSLKYSTPSSPTSKKRRGLRINPNLILCEADYDGGTVMEPSFDSPRGLKRLFNEMNSGKRI